MQQPTRQVIAQATWISDHGVTSQGYVGRYGDSSDFPFCSGEGGQIIWLADSIELVRRLARADPQHAAFHKQTESNLRTEMALWFGFRRMCMKERRHDEG